MTKTKIVCTIGPKTNSYETLQKLAHEGMNIARLNMSHGTHEWHQDVIQKIEKINSENQYFVATVLDTKGPEIRSGDLESPLELTKSEKLIISTNNDTNNPANIKTVGINYPGFINDVEIGDTILIEGGVINLKVLDKKPSQIITEVLDDGTLTSRRHLNIRGKSANLPTLTDKDWIDIDFGIRNNMDYIAVSFVNEANTIFQLRKYLEEKGSKIKIISKIESSKAVDNLEEIIEASDAIMVARGDLGSELPVEEVPLIQENIIKLALKYQKPVIVATQMIESMIDHPTPTRAEVTDIFNAVKQDADAIMMSGETANGNYPLKALNVMKTVATKAETHRSQHQEEDVYNKKVQEHDINVELAHGVSRIADNIRAKCIIVFSHTGYYANLISHFRPQSPIFIFGNDETIVRQLSLNWGTQALKINFDENPENTVQEALKTLKNIGEVQFGDQVVILSDVMTRDGEINSIQIREIK